jgi:hypothetical protein
MPAESPTAAPAARAQIEQGRVAFNRGAYFEAHERWEEIWRGERGAERLALQGLIQVAAGLHHLDQGRGRAAARLLAKGIEKLASGGPGVLPELRIQDLGREVERLLAQLDRVDGPTRLPGSFAL